MTAELRRALASMWIVVAVVAVTANSNLVGDDVNEVSPRGNVPFIRGDANEDGALSIGDPILMLRRLFVLPAELAGPRCADALDGNDDGNLDLSDAVHVLGYLFLGAPEPPEPFPDCEGDPTQDALGCRTFDGCESPDEIENAFGMRFVLIQPGTFMMGSPDTERGRDVDFYGRSRVSDELRHAVTLTYPFYLCVVEVSQGLYREIMRDTPTVVAGARYEESLPVFNVSWNEAIRFCARLSRREGLPAGTYRLPTEAEWEYACRAGTTTRFWFGDALECNDSDVGPQPQFACPWLEEVDTFKTAGSLTLTPVGSNDPNAWGLREMHGNVGEWCLDWYGTYPSGPVVDPAGPATGSAKVVRGYGWWSLGDGRSARRIEWSHVARRPNGCCVGFRVVRVVPGWDPIGFRDFPVTQ